MAAPKKGVAYTFDLGLVDSANRPSFKANPTLAAGDFKLSKSEGAFANLTTLPTVTPAGGVNVKVSLSATEMNSDRLMVSCIDAAGGEWDDVLIYIFPTVVTVDDVVRSTTPANTLDINAAGEVGLDLDNTSGTIAAGQIAAGALDGKGDWNIGKSGYSLTTPPPTAAANADAVWDEAQSAHVSAGSFGEIATEIAAIPTTPMRGTDGANTTTPPTAAAIADAVHDEALSGHVVAGSAGKKLSDIPTTAMRGTDNAALASVATEARLAELDAANLPATADAILADTGTDGVVLANSAISAGKIAAGAMDGKGDWNIGKTGYSLSAAAIDAIWDELVTGHVTASSFAKLLTDNLDTTVGSRMAEASINTTAGAVDTVTDVTTKTGYSLATPPPTAAAITDAVLDELLSGHAIAGSVGKKISDIPTTAMRGTDGALTDKTGFSLSSTAIDAIWDELVTGHITASSFAKLLVDNLNATVGSRMAEASISTTGGAVDNVTTLTGHTAQTGDSFARLGAPVGASVSADINTIITDTNELQTDDVPGLIAALNNLSSADVNAAVDSALDTAIPGIPTAGSINDVLKDLDAVLPGSLISVLTAADVNTEVSDVLKTDVIAELPQGIPSATPTFEKALMLIYMALRNKLDITATLKEIHNDAGTVIAKKTLSDDGTTYSEAEMASGP